MTSPSYVHISGMPERSIASQLLRAAHDSPAEWLGTRLRRLPSLLVALIVAVAGALLLGVAMTGLGLLTTEVLLSFGWLADADAWLPTWLETQRTPFWTDASYVASRLADAMTVIALVGGVALMLVLRRRWRLASFLVFAGLAAPLAYSVTVQFVTRERPADVTQLDTYNLHDSFPSGHVGTAIAVYGGLALLATAHFRNVRAQAAIWTVAVAIPLVVAWSRLYRGQHHPSDIAAGVLVGLGALIVGLFAIRTARAAAELRAGGGR